MIKKTDPIQNERRQYVRLDSVFPVQFRILDSDGKTLLSEWLQGFTGDVGKGGICLEVNNLKDQQAQIIKTLGTKMSLAIQIPLTGAPVNAEARIAWVKDVPGTANKYLVGLTYENIAADQNRRIMHFALTKRLFAPVTLLIIAVLVLGFSLGTFLNYKLIKGNKALVDQLVNIVQSSSIAKQKIKQIYIEREDLLVKIKTLEMQLKTLLEEKTKLVQQEWNSSKRMNEVSILLDKITRDKDDLQNQLLALQNRENNVAEELLSLDKRKATLEKANVEKMYQWLTVHQNLRTGLVMSFEGDKDIQNWGFIYDQALAALAYSNFSDFPRAKKIFDFFNNKAKRINGQFINAYYVNDGTPAEFIVHSGPNIWIGIAIAQYTKMSRDNSYLKLAEEIAKGIINLQNQDSEGGIRGGPEVNWYATEHNLDAYAFFNMLYTLTGKEEYAQARDKVLNWISLHTYDKYDVPVKRGKGDSTIATDTYAWSIAAIGPEKLISMGMNPDRIMEFAEKTCVVEVEFRRPEGKIVKVKGFDFAPQCHVARGGVISCEWTAQMVLSLKIMAEYYYKKGLIAKARSYEFKADQYLVSLTNMIISSPSPSGQGASCLPYATHDFVDTGHGWMTPKGNTTGSVSGTAYTLFAYYKFNPLEM